VAGEEKTDIAKIQFTKWYRCTVEFNFLDSTATYYLDGVKVGAQMIPGVLGLRYVYRLFVMDPGRMEWPRITSMI